MGKKVFAGNIIDIQDKNIAILENLEYSVTALDYTRIFDKKLLNDTYADRDSRYIVNDFCNTTINKNQVLDQFDYANTTALRVVWSNSPTLDTSDYMEGTGCLSYSYVPAGSTNTTATLPAIDISAIVQTTQEFVYLVDNNGDFIVDNNGDFIGSYETV